MGSFRKTLVLHIRKKYPRMMTLDEIHDLAKMYGHKQSYAERELRPSKSPEVEAIKRNGNVSGYTVSRGYRDER